MSRSGPAGALEANEKHATAVSEGLLENLERDYNEVMDALGSDETLDHFRMEYDKFYNALRKSHTGERNLVAKCQELTQELLSNAAKMQAAVKLSQGDHSTIEALKKEIEKAWRTVDTANDKDLRARETVKTLQEEIASLQNILEEGSAMPSDHATIEELKLENKRMQVDIDEMSRTVENLSKDITEVLMTQKKAETDLATNAEEAKRIVDRFELVKQEHRREKNARERAEFQCRELLLLLRTRESELHTKTQILNKLEVSVVTLRNQIREDQDKRQQLLRKVDTAEKQLFHTQQSLADSVDTTSELMDRLHDLDTQTTNTVKETAETRLEVDRIHRVRDKDYKELGRLVQQNENLRQEHESMRQQKLQVQRRIDSLIRERKSLEEALTMINREKEALEKKGLLEDHKKEAIKKLLGAEAENQKDIEDSMAREREISLRLKNTLNRLEKEREMCRVEVSQVHGQHNGAKEELKMAMLMLEETQKKIEESEAKLSKQQKKYEQVRTERNQFSKKLVEAQDEIVELKQKFKVMDHQIVQFKEELHIKEKRYQEETSKQKNASNRLAKARRLVNEYTAAFDEAKVKSETISQQIRQLVKIITICDKELSEQQQHFLKISNERDLLGSQLIRRNDELALLYEKLRVHQETQSNGESAYRARIEDLRLLRNKIREINRQAALADFRSKDLKEVKRRLRKLEHSISMEQAKVAALSEELESPQNAARWRRVEGKDPTPEELEKKAVGLQKRLITKSEEALEQEMTLQEKERLVTELETILARQPRPEVAQHLNSYHRDLLRKNAQMKQAAAELNMTNTHVAELKYEVERLRRELQVMKRNYYEMKVRNDVMVNPPLTALLPSLRGKQQQQQQQRENVGQQQLAPGGAQLPPPPPGPQQPQQQHRGTNPWTADGVLPKPVVRAAPWQGVIDGGGQALALSLSLSLTLSLSPSGDVKNRNNVVDDVKQSLMEPITNCIMAEAVAPAHVFRIPLPSQ
eukprot:gene11055-7686_t